MPPPPKGENYVDVKNRQIGIGGVKVFAQNDNNYARISVANTSVTLGDDVEKRRVAQITMLDKNGDWISCFQGNFEPSGNTSSSIYTRLADKTASCSLTLGFNNGDPYTSTVTPIASSNNTNIATTAWFRKSDCGVRTVIEFGYDTPSGGFLKVYNNGWIEQGGYISSTAVGDSYVTINLWRAFSNTKYFVMNQHEQTVYTSNWGSGCASIHTSNKTTTSFELSVDGCTNTSGYYWMACGI